MKRGDTTSAGSLQGLVAELAQEEPAWGSGAWGLMVFHTETLPSPHYGFPQCSHTLLNCYKKNNAVNPNQTPVFALLFA